MSPQEFTQRIISRNRLFRTEHVESLLHFVGKLLPPVISRKALELTLNRLFAADIKDGTLDFLRNRTVAVTLHDPDFAFTARLMEKHLRVGASSGREDASIKLAFSDVIALAKGETDPDTLFFRRRLMLSGDTELSLGLKNFLDTVDIQQSLVKLMPTPAQSLARSLTR